MPKTYFRNMSAPQGSKALLSLVAFLALAPAASAEGDEPLGVYLHHARVLKLDRPVSKVIIGSDAIADATVADTKTIVLTGKALGATNLVILDAQDNPIVDQRILVSTQESNTLRVYRSTETSTWTCAPNCEEQSKPKE